MRTGRALILAALGLAIAERAPAAPPDHAASPRAEEPDRYEFLVHSETYAELFRRALLPGPNGAIVATDTVAPIHEYFRLSVRDLDTSLGRDAIDVELAAYGRLWLGEPQAERRLDGDVQVANVRYKYESLFVRLGRQNAAGGAARYVRFDGATVGAELGAGISVEGYGGFTVLPRWNRKPGYQQLGAATDTLLRAPEALPEPDRSGNVLGGARIGWSSAPANVALSFHEQHEDLGLTRRNLGLDGRVFAWTRAAFGANGVFDLDAERFQDARVFVDATPQEDVDVSVEYLHTEPRLFLSRQSVLSVFSTDSYEEVAASAVIRATDRLAVESGGGLEFYDDGNQGARGEVAARVQPGPGRRTLVRIGYGRVVAIGNGYNTLRASLSRRILRALTGTLEGYLYLYDEPIRGSITSETYAGTLSYRASDMVRLLWGVSVAESPYAFLDVQTLVRVSLDFDFSHRSSQP